MLYLCNLIMAFAGTTVALHVDAPTKKFRSDNNDRQLRVTV